MNYERQPAQSAAASAAGIIGWALFVAAAVTAISFRHLTGLEKAAHKSESTPLRSAQAEVESARELMECVQVDLEWQLGALESERNGRKKDVMAMETALMRLLSKLDDTERLMEQSNEKKEELVAAIAMAGDHLYYVPSDARLPQRMEREGTRFIGRDGVARLRAMLHNAPHFDVEIGCMKGDADSLAISEELRVAFEEAGSKVRELIRYSAPPIKLRGVSIHSRPQHDEVLGNIIGQIFREVSQEKNQWVGRDEIVPLKPGGPEPDIRIFVGSK